MSNANMTTEVQLRYLVQWFSEWSELQRGDFLPILAERVGSNVEPVYVNGIVNSLSGVTCDEKPMNLFQCRVKLFRNWTENWTNDDINKLIQRVTEIDSEFGDKLTAELKPTTEKAEASDIVEEEIQIELPAQVIEINAAPIEEPNQAIDTTIQREMIEA